MLQQSLIELIPKLEQGQILVCEAEAGSGKTYAVMQSIAQLPEKAHVFISAPTHVAVDELREKLVAGTKCTVTFGTTAKLVGRYLEMNKATGELENRFAPSGVNYDLVVMDEVSAVPSCDVHRLLLSKSPAVLLGDREQLNAVKSKQAAVWTCDWANYEHRVFTFIALYGQRRASGPMYDFIRSYRDKITPLTKSFEGVRVLYSGKDFSDDFTTQLKAAYENGDDLAQYCYFAYRNSAVDAMQLRLRTEVFGTPEFAVGEVLRVSSAEGLATGQLLTVLSSTKSQVQIAGEVILTNNVEVQTRSGEVRALKAVHPLHLAEFAKLLQSLKDNKDWTKFFLLEQHFAVLVNANAMTVHKAQGRTVAHVWVDVEDIASKRKLLYVAYGRAQRTITAVWPYERWAKGTAQLLKNCTLDELNALRQPFGT